MNFSPRNFMSNDEIGFGKGDQQIMCQVGRRTNKVVCYSVDINKTKILQKEERAARTIQKGYR